MSTRFIFNGPPAWLRQQRTFECLPLNDRISRADSEEIPPTEADEVADELKTLHTSESTVLSDDSNTSELRTRNDSNSDESHP